MRRLLAMSLVACAAGGYGLTVAGEPLKGVIPFEGTLHAFTGVVALDTLTWMEVSARWGFRVCPVSRMVLVELRVKRALFVLLLAAVLVIVGGCGGGDAGSGEPRERHRTDTGAATPPGMDASQSPSRSSISTANEKDVAALEKLGARVEHDHRGRVWKVAAVGPQITDAELAHLRGLPDLESLEIAECPVTDAGLAYLTDLTELQILYLADLAITDAGLVHLQGLTGLTVLSLQNTKLTGRGLVHLEGLTNLEVLNLSGTDVTDDALENIVGLVKINTLALEGTKITDAGLNYCRPLEQLRVLNLNRCAVTDAGLESLLGMTNLRMLYAAGTSLTEDNVEDFRDKMTSLAVQR